jgi:hypothetical protein
MVLNFEEFNFTVTRLRYLDAVVTNIPGFTPDGRTAEEVAQLGTGADASLKQLLRKYNESNTANAGLQKSYAASHEACVSVYACMKSCYRKDTVSSATIQRLPKHDTNPEKTCTRMKAIADYWPTLPKVPGTNAPFAVGDITQDAFDRMCDDLDKKLRNARMAETALTGDLKRFTEQNAEWDNFINHALVQGRAQFKEGTAARAIIDRIPTTPATQEPDQAQVTAATNPANGAVRLEFSANHATSFKVLHKGPNDPEFSEVADVLLPGVYEAAGLAAGAHAYKIAGVNSRGSGPESAVASVIVSAAAAA